MKKRSVEDRLIESVRQAVEIREGRRMPAKEYDLPLTARRAHAAAAPEYDKTRVTAIRKQMNVSQSVFADALNVSLGTVRSWEQGARVPDGAARRLLEVAEQRPDVIRGFVRGKVEYGRRENVGARKVRETVRGGMVRSGETPRGRLGQSKKGRRK